MLAWELGLLPRAAPRATGAVIDLSLGEGAATRLVVTEPATPPRGALLLVHGLGGSADGRKARWLAASAVARGWRSVSLDMRGAGGSALQQRLYTAADVDELDAATRHPAFAHAPGPRVAVGLSLGGGILLRWLGIRGHGAAVDAAVALAPTAHLPSCARALSRLRHRLYDLAFAWSLGRRIRRVAAASGRRRHAFGAHFTMKRLDDDFASLVCGMPDAERYWEHASAHHHVGGIARPVLVIAAEDDPFVPIEPLRAFAGGSPMLDLRAFRYGSHLAFLERAAGGLRPRLADLLLAPLEALAARGRRPDDAAPAAQKASIE